MSKRKGRKYEREVIALLEQYLKTRDVTPNAGDYSFFGCDLLLYPDREPFHDKNPLKAEVKYSKNASGFKSLYKKHLELVGLAGVIEWKDGYYTSGVSTFCNAIMGSASVVSVDECLMGSKTLHDWFYPHQEEIAPRDVLFLRASSRNVLTPAWITAWRGEKAEIQSKIYTF